MASEPTLDELIAWWIERSRSTVPGTEHHRRVTATASHLRRLKALDAAVGRVRELHYAVERDRHDGGGYECASCYYSDGVAESHPCWTLRALDAGGGA